MTETRLTLIDSEAVKTLSAIKQFTRYLKEVEDDLSRTTKKLRNKEIAQSAGFVGTGIYEALHYLEIVKKVVEKTQRALKKKALDQATGLEAPEVKEAISLSNASSPGVK